MKIYTSLNVYYAPDNNMENWDRFHPTKQVELLKDNYNKDINIFTFSPFLLRLAEIKSLDIINIDTMSNLEILEDAYKLIARPFQYIEDLRWD